MSGVPDTLDVVYRVLDLQVLDVNGRRCGKVDDVELDGEPGAPLRVAALLIGRGAWPARLRGWRARLARRLVGPEVLGGNVIRVPWELVDSVAEAVVLTRPAEDLDLGRGDRELEPVMRKVPRA